MSTGESRDGRVWFAQVLRGPACVLIVVSHYGDLYLRQQPLAAAIGHFPPVPHLPDGLGAFDFGEVAVCVFFLVSGFVIPFSLALVSVRAYTVRRALRIYPTIVCCLAITLGVLALQAHLGHTAQPYSWAVVASNASLLAPYLGKPWIEPVLWTLAIEELFYVIAALLSARGRLDDARWLVGFSIFVAVVSALHRSTGGNPAALWLTFNLSFLPLVLLGTAVHQVWVRRWPLQRGIAVGVALVAAFSCSMYFGPNHGLATVYVLSGLGATAVFVACAVGAVRIPYSRALDGLSNISFPLYLLHATNGYITMHWLHAHGVEYFGALPMAAAASFAGAVLVHRFIELPTQRLGRRLGPSRSRVDQPAPGTASPGVRS